MNGLDPSAFTYKPFVSTLRVEGLNDQVKKGEEQPWKKWFLYSDEHPLECGKYNYGGHIIRKAPAILSSDQFSKAKVFSPTAEEDLYKKMRYHNALVLSNWVRTILMSSNSNSTSYQDEQKNEPELVPLDENILDTIIKYTLTRLLSWHTQSLKETNNDGTLEIIDGNVLTVNNDFNSVNLVLMDYICDWNHLYINKKQTTFGIKLTLKEFNNPICFGFGFMVINHETLTPYISNWRAFMDEPDINVGFGVFFVARNAYGCYRMNSFCEPRLYQNYLIENCFRDGTLVQLNEDDEIKIILNHKTEVSVLYINDNEICDLFFGAPPYIAPAIHYIGGQDWKAKCTFQCDLV